MRQQSLFWSSFAWLIFMLVAGCDSSPTPMPTVTPALPTATMPSTAINAASTVTNITNTVTVAPFRINLPDAAPILYPTDAAWERQLVQLQQQQPQLANYLAALATTSTVKEQIALIQWPVAGETLNLVAAAVPSEGLSLQSYLSAAQAELEQSRLALGTGIVVQSATMRYDLHKAHVPLATLQYTLLGSGGAAAALSGYQTAMLDQTGSHLLLLTFIATPIPMAAAQEQIATILAQLQETTLTQ